MNSPATLYRRLDDSECMGRPCETVVARGPLVILAHGLMAIPEKDRDTLWIRSIHGDIPPADVEQLLAAWHGRTARI